MTSTARSEHDRDDKDDKKDDDRDDKDDKKDDKKLQGPEREGLWRAGRP